MKITGTQKDLDKLVGKNTGLNTPEIPTPKELEKKQKENEELRKIFKGKKE